MKLVAWVETLKRFRVLGPAPSQTDPRIVAAVVIRSCDAGRGQFVDLRRSARCRAAGSDQRRTELVQGRPQATTKGEGISSLGIRPKRMKGGRMRRDDGSDSKERRQQKGEQRGKKKKLCVRGGDL